MLYFSELYKRKVCSDDGVVLGILEDLIFSVDKHHPVIRKLVVIKKPVTSSPFFSLKKKEQITISTDFLLRITHARIVVKKTFIPSHIDENELYVKKNLLDTQVIDIEDNNIVRVNDVLIQYIELKSFEIYGADISIAGIFRWFYLEDFVDQLFRFFHLSIPHDILPWPDIQPLELSRGRVKLNYRSNKLNNLHPADLADYLETQNSKNSFAILQTVDKEYLAQVISELNPNFQISILRKMSLDKVALIIASMDPDDAVDVLHNFSNTKQQEILKKISNEDSFALRKLLSLGGTPLGQFLNSDYLTVFSNDFSSEVLKKIKDETADFSFLEYIYVVNRENQLIGVFNLHEFLHQNMYTPVFRFMVQPVIAAHLNTPVDAAYRRMIRYKIRSLPVIDPKKRILGIVSIDDLGEYILEKSNI